MAIDHATKIRAGLGIGIGSPDYDLHIARTGEAVLAVEAQSDTDSGYLRIRRSRASLAAVNDNDLLGQVEADGHDGTAWSDARAAVSFYADETWSVGNHGSRIELSTTPAGSTTLTSRMTIDNAGSVTMPAVYDDTVGGTNIDLAMDDTGKIGYVSSALETKKYVKSIGNADWMYDLRPVTFKYRKDSSKKWQYGFIAEEVEKLNKDFVFYSRDGDLRGVSDKQLIPILVKTTQDLRDRIISLEQKMKRFETKK